jgi:hypothetical protein
MARNSCGVLVDGIGAGSPFARKFRHHAGCPREGNDRRVPPNQSSQEQKGTDGAIRRWAVEGPSGLQLNRKSFPKDGLKSGDVVEVCGYVSKEPIMWQIASTDPGAVSLSGRLINAETIVMPDGHEQSWGDYGAHKCFAPGYNDQHSK